MKQLYVPDMGPHDFWLDNQPPRLIKGEWEAFGWFQLPMLLLFFAYLTCARLGVPEGFKTLVDWVAERLKGEDD